MRDRFVLAFIVVIFVTTSLRILCLEVNVFGGGTVWNVFGYVLSCTLAEDGRMFDDLLQLYQFHPFCWFDVLVLLESSNVLGGHCTSSVGYNVFNRGCKRAMIMSITLATRLQVIPCNDCTCQSKRLMIMPPP